MNRANKLTAGIITLLFLCYSVYAERASDSSGEISFSARCLANWKGASGLSVTFDEARGIAFLGSFGCVCVLDVTTPSAPVQISRCVKDEVCFVHDLFYENSTKRLYIAAGIFGICVLDVADPLQLKLIGHYDTPGHASGIFVVDARVCVADGDAGLRIIDASIPSAMRELGSFKMSSACNVYVSGQYAYITNLGLQIVNIANPAEPQVVAYHETPGVAYGLDLVEPFMYVADDWCGIRIIDMSDPMYPQEVGHYDTPGHARDVKVIGNYAYVADCDAGLRIIDISKPFDCEEVGYADTPDARSIHLCGHYVFLADACLGLKIYKVE